MSEPSSKPYTIGTHGIALRVRLQPGSSSNQVEGLHVASDGLTSLKVRVRAQPEKGQANKALIKLLSKALGVRQADLNLVAGVKERSKTVVIDPSCSLDFVTIDRLSG